MFFQFLYFANFMDLYEILFVKIATSNTLFAHVITLHHLHVVLMQFAKLLFVKSIFLDILEMIIALKKQPPIR